MLYAAIRADPFPTTQMSDRTQRSDRRFVDTNNDRHVRTHYNTIHNNTRAHTKMARLRDFNNFIKWLQIFEFSEPYEVVLDMACGKGGDLEKWRRAGVDGFIGIDIANISIENARDRHRQLEHKSFWIDLVVGNCFGENIKDILHPGAIPVDIVSCQFALHYAFDTEERLRRTLSNVSTALKPGGRFIGTIPNSEYIAENLREGKSKWGNKIFSITFDPNEECVKNPGVFNSITGNKYMFFLNEAVENVPEYVVPFDKLVSLAKEYNLELLQKEPFLQYFDRKVHSSDSILNESVIKKLTDNIGTPIFDAEQLEVCSIYLAFAFKRV